MYAANLPAPDRELFRAEFYRQGGIFGDGDGLGVLTYSEPWTFAPEMELAGSTVPQMVARYIVRIETEIETSFDFNRG